MPALYPATFSCSFSYSYFSFFLLYNDLSPISPHHTNPVISPTPRSLLLLPTPGEAIKAQAAHVKMINRKKNLSDYDELMASHCQVGSSRSRSRRSRRGSTCYPAMVGRVGPSRAEGRRGGHSAIQVGEGGWSGVVGGLGLGLALGVGVVVGLGGVEYQ